jgi:hypothetical protein
VSCSAAKCVSRSQVKEIVYFSLSSERDWVSEKLGCSASKCISRSQAKVIRGE